MIRAGTSCQIHIGTSGWHYAHWKGKGRLYPERCSAKDMFQCYLRNFDTVEINNSFYRLPSPETFVAWHQTTPKHFLFSVKASRFLTHNKKLKDPEQPLEMMMPRFEVLKEKLGPILFQLPPKWNANLERLNEFLRVLREQYGSGHRYTIEFRHPGWLTTECYAILRRYNVAFCIYELAGFETPHEITADFAYVRLHGPGNKYQGSYAAKQLRRWADEILSWKQTLRGVYVYFDNDDSGYAADNAITLKKMVEGDASRSAA